ncbi:MAG TPA: efflux RND transporter periplasmic adaptor subunit [Cytophagaceae bacterium]|jgi:RND family efflux transporter MFP subunit
MTKVNFLIMAMFLFYACKNKDGADKKKDQLEKYRSEVSDLNKKIQALEADLANSGANAEDEIRNRKHVAVAPITSGEFNHFVEVQGRVDSDKNITISPMTAGAVTAVLAVKGQKVRKGQVLARIEAEIVRTGMDEVRNSLAFANTVYEKQKRLWDQKIGTEIQYLQAKNNKESLERRLASMQEQYNMSIIKSTIDGEVDEVYIKQGENAAPGMPAFRVVNTSGFKIKAEVPESFIAVIKEGFPVQIYLPDLKDTIQSKVTTVSDVISNTNRTFGVEVDLKRAKENNLKANMIAYLRIQDYNKPKAIAVPINTIQHGESGDYVFVAENNKAKKVPVTIGKSYKSNVEITAGLKEGDKIITTGYQDLVDGQNISL